MKNDSSLSNLKIYYHLNLPVPILHWGFSRKLSQNPEYVKMFVVIEKTLVLLVVVDE